MQIRSIGAACLMVLLMLVSACNEKAGGDEEGAAPAQTGEAAASARDKEREVQPVASLPDARSLGIDGWQGTEHIGRGGALGDGSTLQGAGAQRALADTRPELSIIPGEHGRHYLTGLVEPADAEAVAGVFASADVRVNGMASLPPTSEIRSLGQMAAAAVQLVSVEPSAAALVGAGADPAVIARLERAAGAWPTEARVWRIIGLPPDADEGSRISFQPDNDPDDDHEEARHKRLQAMGILEFAPVEGGGPGDLISASVRLPYQNQDRLDREFSARFLYDRGTGQWVLYNIGSVMSRAAMMRLAKAGEWDQIESTAHSLDLLSVLPDCHLVVGPDGPLLCK